MLLLLRPPAHPSRESSFFDNPRVPAEVRQGKVIVEVCAETAANYECSDGSAPAPLSHGRVKIRPNLDSAKLAVALSGVKSAKHFEFTTMTHAFKNFTDVRDWEKFYARMRIYGSIWCCVNAHPGHVHYDMWWDIPHVDKHNKRWEKWEVTTGP